MTRAVPAAVPALFGRVLLMAALVVVVAALPRSAAAGDTERAYLRQKLVFAYAEHPNNLTELPWVLDNAKIADGIENEPFWKNAKVPGLQKLVRGLLQAPGKGGDDYLQMLTSWIVRVLDKPVLINLINDVDAPLTGDAMTMWSACDDGSGHAWPCAMNQAVQDDGRAQCAKANNEPTPERHDIWAGHMTLGQTAFNGGTAGTPIATFVHELVHTQDRSDKQDVRFWLSGKFHNYGADGDHYDVEAVPNVRDSYGEGIANTMALFIDSPTRKRMFDWFANDDAVMVEKVAQKQSVYLNKHPCTSLWNFPSQDIWLYNQLKTAGATEVARSPNPYPAYAYFRIRDIPPRFIVHSEYIIAMTFSEYAWHLGIGKFLKALKSNDALLFRTPDSPIAKLYETLCTMGLDGRPLASVQNVNEAGPKPYLIPLAYADFFTSYQSKTKADYASIFENKLPQAWVDMYWDGYKDAVRAAAQIDATHKPRFDQLTDIAIALGVNQSVPDEAP